MCDRPAGILEICQFSKANNERKLRKSFTGVLLLDGFQRLEGNRKISQTAVDGSDDGSEGRRGSSHKSRLRGFVRRSAPHAGSVRNEVPLPSSRPEFCF